MCRNLSIYYTFGRSEGPKTGPESARTSTAARDGGKNGEKRRGTADGTGCFGSGPDFCQFWGQIFPWKPREVKAKCFVFFRVFSRCVACPLKTPQGRPREAPGRPRGPFLVRFLVDVFDVFWSIFATFFGELFEFIAFVAQFSMKFRWHRML